MPEKGEDSRAAFGKGTKGLPLFPFQPQAVVIEKLDANLFEGLLDRCPHDPEWLAAFVLEIPNGLQRHAHLVRKHLLRPVQQSARRAALSGRNLHAWTVMCAHLKSNVTENRLPILGNMVQSWWVWSTEGPVMTKQQLATILIFLKEAAVQIDNALAEAYRSGDALTKDNITVLRREIAFEISRLEVMHRC
jgi:hypothetical protein